MWRQVWSWPHLHELEEYMLFMEDFEVQNQEGEITEEEEEMIEYTGHKKSKKVIVSLHTVSGQLTSRTIKMTGKYG